MMPYCPRCNEWHTGFWDCAARKIASPNAAREAMGIITDDKGVVLSIVEPEPLCPVLRL